MRVSTVVLWLGTACLLSANLASGQSEPAAQPPDLPAEWVNSDNDDLSLRLRVKSVRVATQDSIVVIAEIRNNRQGPVTILRPFGDHYFAEAVQIKIWNEQEQVKYTGPTADYDLNKTAFITLEAKEIATDTLELPVRHFAESGKAGNYVLRYDYSYWGTWDKVVADEGVNGIWHGAVCSREVQLKKHDGTAKSQPPSQQQLDADCRTLLSFTKILTEKPDDPTVRQEAAALAIRLAPHLPGNRLVWEVLIKTRALKDGMSLAEAEELLGPPTRKSDKSVGWYFNPYDKHVAPYLQANVSNDELTEWTLTNR